jgi:hypothetical protein
VIVRVSSHGQFRLDDAALDELNRLDNDVVQAVESGDESRYSQALAALVRYVEEQGERLPDEELVGSDHVLPPPDMTLEEARETFTGEGMIPG